MEVQFGIDVWAVRVVGRVAQKVQVKHCTQCLAGKPLLLCSKCLSGDLSQVFRCHSLNSFNRVVLALNFLCYTLLLAASPGKHVHTHTYTHAHLSTFLFSCIPVSEFKGRREPGLLPDGKYLPQKEASLRLFPDPEQPFRSRPHLLPFSLLGKEEMKGAAHVCLSVRYFLTVKKEAKLGSHGSGFNVTSPLTRGPQSIIYNSEVKKAPKIVWLVSKLIWKQNLSRGGIQLYLGRLMMRCSGLCWGCYMIYCTCTTLPFYCLKNSEFRNTTSSKSLG
ncbi:uncharacterized protein LOC124239683 [Equus quagga]|uniref:uncharacterized protein LOC124239683 n=1 Tax=Equus quagga TaxID=89248 RepID=UPI001EE1867E|nr:uncharacterized protein LOC124239683 [Equus quagga]